MTVIAQASQATDAVLEKVHAAQQALSLFNSRIVNGAGVLGDPSRRRADLIEAIAALDAALEIMQTTTWPREQDYAEHDL